MIREQDQTAASVRTFSQVRYFLHMQSVQKILALIQLIPVAEAMAESCHLGKKMKERITQQRVICRKDPRMVSFTFPVPLKKPVNVPLVKQKKYKGFMESEKKRMERFLNGKIILPIWSNGQLKICQHSDGALQL